MLSFLAASFALPLLHFFIFFETHEAPHYLISLLGPTGSANGIGSSGFYWLLLSANGILECYYNVSFWSNCCFVLSLLFVTLYVVTVFANRMSARLKFGSADAGQF